MDLKHSVEHASNSSVRLTVTIPQSSIAAKYAEELKKITKSIQLPGFRKGHVPAHILESKYSKEIQGEVAANLINDSIQELFEKIDEKPLAFSQPELDGKPDIDLKKDFVFTVKYDVMPTIEKVDVSKVSIAVPEVKIGEADLETELRAIQERNSVVMDKKDDAKCAKGDVVTVDYCELDADGKAVAGSERQDFVYTAGEKEQIDHDLDADILGMKKGESKEVKRSDKIIKVTVKALKEKKLPAIDDELAQDVDEKFKTLDDLKKSLAKRMERSRDLRLREIKTDALLKELVKSTPIELPASLVTAEKEYRLHTMAQQFGMKVEQLEKMFLTEGKTRDDLLNNYMGNTEEKIKESLIVQALLKERNMAVSKEDVEAEYVRLAEASEEDVAETKKRYDGDQDAFIEALKERKLFAEIFEKIKITKGKKLNLEELFDYSVEKDAEKAESAK
ncbi:MAG: trigger factor [Treponemataceae bacterium]|nr:MAG: trigger factor [Treponemataceae bacterium]